MNKKQKDLKIFFLLFVIFVSAFHYGAKAQTVSTYYNFPSEIKNPRSLKVDTAGNFYFVSRNNYSQREIYKLSAGGILSTVVSGNYFPQHLALDNAGNVFFSDDNTSPAEIKKVNPDGTITSFISGNFYPEDIIFDVQGDMYFTNDYDLSILKVKPDGTVSTFLAEPNFYPRFLAVDKSGTLYFTDNNTSPPKINKFSPGMPVNQFVSGNYSPQNLTIDTSGNLFFIDYYSSPSNIKRITPDGTVSLVHPEFFQDPKGLTIDRSGNLYFIDTDNGEYLIKIIQNPDAPCTIPPPPVAYNTAICYGTSISLSANGFGELRWYDAPFGGNLINTGESFTTGPLTTDTRFYIESYFCNTTTARTELHVTVIPPPAITITGKTTGIDSVSLTASGGVSYLWSGGKSTTTAQNIFTMSGMYSVKVTNAEGCIATAQADVTVYRPGLNKYGSIFSEKATSLNQNGAIAAKTNVDRNGKIYGQRLDGLTADNAAGSAFQIKQNFPASADGYYWIKNPNINGGNAFKIYADMTTDGGGWTLIMCNASNAGWNYTNAISLNPEAPSLISNYSIIGWADYIKKSASGFQYMIDANTRNSFGGIWTANEAYTFVKNNNTQTNVTLDIKFGTWSYHDSGIEKRMPWYSNCSGFITTSRLCNSAYYGTLIAESGWNPAPWINNGCGTAGCMLNPGRIWYWVR